MIFIIYVNSEWLKNNPIKINIVDGEPLSIISKNLDD